MPILCNIIVANCFLTKAICLHWNRIQRFRLGIRKNRNTRNENEIEFEMNKVERDILFTLLPAVLYNLGTTHGLVCTLILFIWKIVRNIFCILWWNRMGWDEMRCDGWVCFKLFRLGRCRLCFIYNILIKRVLNIWVGPNSWGRWRLWPEVSVTQCQHIARVCEET